MNDLVLTLLVLAVLVMGGLWFWNRLEAKRSQDTHNPNLAQESKSVYDRLKEINPIAKPEDKDSIGLFNQAQKSAQDVQDVEPSAQVDSLEAKPQEVPAQQAQHESPQAPKVSESAPAQDAVTSAKSAQEDVVDATNIFQLPKTGHQGGMSAAVTAKGSVQAQLDAQTQAAKAQAEVTSQKREEQETAPSKPAEPAPAQEQKAQQAFKVKIDVDAKALVREALGTQQGQTKTEEAKPVQQGSLFDEPAKMPVTPKRPVSIANSRGCAVADIIKAQEPFKPDNIYDMDEVPLADQPAVTPKGLREVPFTHLSETMANIICRHPVSGKEMLEMYKNLNRTNLNLRVYVRNAETGRWFAPSQNGSYSEMAIVMRLAGRDYCINEIDASRFTMAVQNVCIALDAESESENAPEMVQRAQLLANSIQKLDCRLTFVIESHDHPSVVEIQKEAQAAGFVQINTQRYALATPETVHSATILLTQRDYDTRTLYLTMLVPMVDPQTNPIRRLFTIANDLCARLNAELQDNSGNPINAFSAQMIQKQLGIYFKGMRSAGIVPGSQLARELFSQDE